MLPVMLRDSKIAVGSRKFGVCLTFSEYCSHKGTLNLLMVLSLAGQASRCASVPQFVPPIITKTKAGGLWGDSTMSGYVYMQCPFCCEQSRVTDYTLRHTGWHGCGPENGITHFDEIGLVEQCEA